MAAQAYIYDPGFLRVHWNRNIEAQKRVKNKSYLVKGVTTIGH